MAEHREFHIPDLDSGWETPEGYAPGITRKVLGGHLDEAAGKGRRTSLVRFEPGAVIPEPVIHTFAEEVYLISGDLVVGCDAEGNGGESFPPGTYAIRPSGVHHGPFTSRGGCVMMEILYFED